VRFESISAEAHITAISNRLRVISLYARYYLKSAFLLYVFNSINFGFAPQTGTLGYQVMLVRFSRRFTHALVPHSAERHCGPAMVAAHTAALAALRTFAEHPQVSEWSHTSRQLGGYLTAEAPGWGSPANPLARREPGIAVASPSVAQTMSPTASALRKLCPALR
jgi:hypothetical protein